MASFQFRLETLQKLRQAERQQRRLELAQAFQADEFLQSQISTLVAEASQLRIRCQAAAGPGRVNVDELLDIHRYAVVLKGRTQVLRNQRARLQDEIERRRQALVEADRQVKVLEKLREQQREQHRADGQRLEAKDLDEMAQRSTRQAVP